MKADLLLILIAALGLCYGVSVRLADAREAATVKESLSVHMPTNEESSAVQPAVPDHIGGVTEMVPGERSAEPTATEWDANGEPRVLTNARPLSSWAALPVAVLEVVR